VIGNHEYWGDPQSATEGQVAEKGHALTKDDMNAQPGGHELDERDRVLTERYANTPWEDLPADTQKALSKVGGKAAYDAMRAGLGKQSSIEGATQVATATGNEWPTVSTTGRGMGPTLEPSDEGFAPVSTYDLERPPPRPLDISPGPIPRPQPQYGVGLAQMGTPQRPYRSRQEAAAAPRGQRIYRAPDGSLRKVA
jgi:hypothetical protein